MAGNETTHDAHTAAQDDAGAHGHGDVVDDHGHAQEPLGPIDWRAWGAGVLGAAAAGIIAVALYLSANAQA